MSGAGWKTLGPRLWAEEVPAGANTPIYISSYGQSFQEALGPLLSIATLLQSSIARSCDSGSTLRKEPVESDSLVTTELVFPYCYIRSARPPS